MSAAQEPRTEPIPTDILAYRVDLGDGGTEYICATCGADADDNDWYEGVPLTPITNAVDLPLGPSGLGAECSDPFCNDRLPAQEDR